MNTSVYNYEDNGAKKGKIFTKCVGQSKKTFYYTFVLKTDVLDIILKMTVYAEFMK